MRRLEAGANHSSLKERMVALRAVELRFVVLEKVESIEDAEICVTGAVVERVGIVSWIVSGESGWTSILLFEIQLLYS